MADAALFIGFGRAARAREPQAVELFERALGFYGELLERGEVESVQPVLLEPHGGDLSGFVLVSGERAALQRVRESEDFRRLTARAGLVVEGLGVVEAHVGAGVTEQLRLFREQMEEQLGS